MKPYIDLTKPRITWLILMSTGVGYYFGMKNGFHWLIFLHTLIGTALIASGTAALNQWWEHLADAKMNRTKMRPIPAGLVSPGQALVFGTVLSIVGFLELWVGVNALTGILGALTLMSYLFLYTPMKQRSPHATTIGAIPGAMPPLIGFAAASGTLNLEAWVLFGILFLWQFPHFYSIAWMYRDDYARAGIRMLPVVEPDGASTSRQIVAFSVILIPFSLLPVFLAMTGKIYFVGAVVLGMYFLYAGVRVARERTLVRARGVLLASVLYLPVLYGLMMLDRPSL